MTTILATCHVCGDVTLPPAAVRLHTAPTGAWYAFSCSQCHFTTRRPADARLVALLATGGVVCQPRLQEVDVRTFMAEIAGGVWA